MRQSTNGSSDEVEATTLEDTAEVGAAFARAYACEKYAEAPSGANATVLRVDCGTPGASFQTSRTGACSLAGADCALPALVGGAIGSLGIRHALKSSAVRLFARAAA